MNIYLITNRINKKKYVGAELRNNPDYFGSGRLIKNAINQFGKENFTKEIIYTIPGEKSKDWEELKLIESQLILSFGGYPDGYNKHWWTFPHTIEQCAEGGKKGGQIGGKRCQELYPNQSSENGKKTSAMQKENSDHFYNPEWQAKVQAMHRANGKGFWNPECQKQMHIKSDATNKANGTGIYSPGFYAKINAANKANGTGFYNPEWQAKIHEKMKAEGTGIYNEEDHPAKQIAHIYFELDGLFQQMTLAEVLALSERQADGYNDHELKLMAAEEERRMIARPLGQAKLEEKARLKAEQKQAEEKQYIADLQKQLREMDERSSQVLREQAMESRMSG